MSFTQAIQESPGMDQLDGIHSSEAQGHDTALTNGTASPTSQEDLDWWQNLDGYKSYMQTPNRPNTTPAYEDAIQIDNKITFFPRTSKERTILMKPHVGRKGREIDGNFMSFMAAMRSSDQEMSMADIFRDDSAFLLVAQSANMDHPSDLEWLGRNLTLTGWIALFYKVRDYRYSDQIYAYDEEAEEALKKSRADEAAAAAG